MDERELKSLLEALAATPDNSVLRRTVAEILVRLCRHDEAVTHYREALRREPHDEELKLALARCFLQQDEEGQALVLVESLIAQSHRPGPAHLLHAEILLSQGDTARAGREYRRAIDEDPDLADPQLAMKLGAVPSEAADTDHAGSAEDLTAEMVNDPDVERPTIDFSNVGGMEALKDEIRMKVIHPLNKPELFAAYGKKVGGGVLLYGPPGCGKTHLARATAGEVKAGFRAIGVHDVLDMWIGSSEKQLHSYFEAARRSQPFVLFFDEVDALGAKRSDMKQSAGRHLINQFLSELDGATANNDGVLVLAATNAPWHLDPAFRRPGRFDRVIFVPPPDEAGRASILKILLRDKPTSEIDFAKVARKCDRYSGADLKGLVDRAVEGKLEQALKTGRPEPITTKDLLAASKGQRPTTAEWFASARNHVLFANEGGIYDDLLPWVK